MIFRLLKEFSVHPSTVPPLCRSFLLFRHLVFPYCKHRRLVIKWSFGLKVNKYFWIPALHHTCHYVFKKSARLSVTMMPTSAGIHDSAGWWAKDRSRKPMFFSKPDCGRECSRPLQSHQNIREHPLKFPGKFHLQVRSVCLTLSATTGFTFTSWPSIFYVYFSAITALRLWELNSVCFL